ncbi:hypothetical protein Tco_0446799 [Tanacetum coccineum]
MKSCRVMIENCLRIPTATDFLNGHLIPISFCGCTSHACVDLEDSRIQCTLFNHYKHELMSLIGTDMHCPKILIIQFGSVFKIDGNVKVRNLKAATRLFLNGDVPENHAYIRRYRVKFTVVDEQTKTFTYLILFDRKVTQIVGKSAFSLYDLFANIQDKIPHELYDMVGKQ